MGKQVIFTAWPHWEQLGNIADRHPQTELARKSREIQEIQDPTPEEIFEAMGELGHMLNRAAVLFGSSQSSPSTIELLDQMLGTYIIEYTGSILMSLARAAETQPQVSSVITQPKYMRRELARLADMANRYFFFVGAEPEGDSAQAVADREKCQEIQRKSSLLLELVNLGYPEFRAVIEGMMEDPHLVRYLHKQMLAYEAK